MDLTRTLRHGTIKSEFRQTEECGMERSLVQEIGAMTAANDGLMRLLRKGAAR